MTADQHGELRAKLASIPAAERLDFLANLSRSELTRFKRVLGPAELRKLNQHIDRLVAERRKPTVESWLADARAGNASTPEAMIEVLREVRDRLRPQDADWVTRIETTASASGLSKRQREVIGAIYAKYFPKTGR